MNKYLVNILIVIGIFNLGIIKVFSQVGNSFDAPHASLHLYPNSVESTTAEGIIAPKLTRSQLTSKDDMYESPQTNALVFVTTIDGVVSYKTANVIKSGYYYFDGTLWQKIGKTGTYFYLPMFSIPATSVGTGKTFDLYNSVFLKQFVQVGNTDYNTSNSLLIKIPITVYTSNELDYVVTYYDTDIIKINSISTSGVINYDVKSTELSLNSFINVVLITK